MRLIPRLLILLLLGGLAAIASRQANAQDAVARLLLPMGGGYSDLYAGFSQAVIANVKNGQVKILVLPVAYSSDPLSITEGERQINLQDAESRSFEIEEACKRSAPDGLACLAVVAPIFTRADAALASNLGLFTDELSGIFILGGDQTVAMQIIIDTPLEARLEELYKSGVLVGGTSAGCGMQSYTLLGGYGQNFAAGNSLTFGAAEVWNAPGRHGLTFGVKDAILDQHFFQRSRLGRLLNAIVLPGVPHVGIGVDAYTGAQIRDERLLSGVFGLYEVAILDAQTYHAAQGVRYVQLPGSDSYVISIRNILVHLLTQGDFSYDLETRQHSLATPHPVIPRSYSSLRLPEGAGTLILSGDMGKTPQNSPVLTRFVEIAGGDSSRILIIAAGYPTQRSAETNAGIVQKALGNIPTEVIALDKHASQPIPIPENVTGMLFIARDVSLIDPVSVVALDQMWRSGLPLLADNAAASLIGAYYVNYGPLPDDADAAELITQKAFLQGIAEIRPGLGLLEVTVEPQTLEDNRWARLFSLAYAHPKMPAIGLNAGTAIEVNSEGAVVLGDNSIFLFDFGSAALALGENKGYAVANGLLDVFAPGDAVQPEDADVQSEPVLHPTPLFSTLEAVATPTLVPASLTPAPPTPTPLSVAPEAKDATGEIPWPAIAGGGILILVGGRWFWKRRTK